MKRNKQQNYFRDITLTFALRKIYSQADN